MDRLVMLELRRAIQAHENLRQALRETSPDDPDFPALLAAVHSSKLLRGPEIANLVGLSTSRIYELLAQARAQERE